jgi:hypothetical protein
MTVSGISEMLLAVGLLFMFVLTRSRVVILVLPIAALLWMGGRYSGLINEDVLLQTSNTFVGAERTASLRYRLDAEELNLSRMNEHLLLGRKGSGDVAYRNDEGKGMALDAWWLIQITFYGVVGIAGWFMLWCGSVVELALRWRKLTPDLQTLGVAVCILLGVQFVDFLFNSFPSMFLMMLNMGMISALQHYKPVRVVRRVAAPQYPGQQVGQNAGQERGQRPPEMVLP